MRSRAVAFAEIHDQRAPQIAPARDEQDQGAKNSRNSAKVGDRNSSAGCTHSNLGSWRSAAPRSHRPWSAARARAPAAGRRHASCPSTAPPAPAGASSIPRCGNQREHERDHRADRDHDEHGADSARHPASFQKVAAGDSMVPATMAITTGRKNALADIEHRDDGDRGAARPAQRRRTRCAGSPAAARYGCREEECPRLCRKSDVHSGRTRTDLSSRANGQEPSAAAPH